MVLRGDVLNVQSEINGPCHNIFMLLLRVQAARHLHVDVRIAYEGLSHKLV